MTMIVESGLADVIDHAEILQERLGSGTSAPHETTLFGEFAHDLDQVGLAFEADAR
jgi:hypothetical protein